MEFVDYYVKSWQNFSDFSSRTRRREFWYTMFPALVVAMVISLIAKIIPGGFVISILYALAYLIPGIALCVRRLNDTGRSPFLLFLALIPIVGLVVIYFLAEESDAARSQ